MRNDLARDDGPHTSRLAPLRLASLVTAAMISFIASLAHADAPETALALRAGTPGIGVDFDVGLGDHFGARLGYSNFSISRTVTSTDATYDGKLKLSIPSALLDWYVFQGVFHFTAGVAANGTKIDVTGVPSANGTFTVNGNTYSAAQLGSVSGTVKFGNSASPYLGLGWGNPVNPNHRFQVLFDIGAIYGGAPKVSLTANCVVPVSAICTQAQNDVLAEEQKISTNASILKWYPIVNLGFSVRL
jgi:hypothetical protein